MKLTNDWKSGHASQHQMSKINSSITLTKLFAILKQPSKIQIIKIKENQHRFCYKIVTFDQNNLELQMK